MLGNRKPTITVEHARALRPQALFGFYDTAHCGGSFSCADNEYAPFLQAYKKLHFQRQWPQCKAPNANDEMNWLWDVVGALEPTLYLYPNNATFNRAFIDCATTADRTRDVH